MTFPFFQNNKGLVYLDTAATAQKFASVIEAEKKFYEEANANVHRGLYKLSENASGQFEDARKRVAGFINADPEEIIFTRGTTESLNIVAQGWGAQNLQKGDEVLLTTLEHHSNIIPWQMVAKKTGAKLSYVEANQNGASHLGFEKMITDKTKIVSFTGLSNALGVITPAKAIIKKARSHGVLACLDAAQMAVHMPIDVKDLDCDFLAFSGHKLYGPTGIGILYAKKEILENMEPFFGGGEMVKEVNKQSSTWNDIPNKFEAGTPPIAQAIALKAAISEIKKIGYEEIMQHDKELIEDALKKLQQIPDIKIIGPVDSEKQTGVISFVMENIHPHDIAAILDEENIAIRAGHHCCMLLMKQLNIPATARISFGIYNSKNDIDRLVIGLKKVKEIFK